jgi:hypothetical protein
MPAHARLRALAFPAVFLAGVACGLGGLAPSHAQDETSPPPQRTPGPASRLPALNWQKLNARGMGSRVQCFRSKVPGGWLVLARSVTPGAAARSRARREARRAAGEGPRGGAEQDQGQLPGLEQDQQQERPRGRGGAGGRGGNAPEATLSLTFVPDPEHSWDGGSVD